MHAVSDSISDGDCRENATPDIVSRPATAADIEAYYGEASRYTMKAIAVEMNGNLVGLIGVSKEHTIGKFFCDFRPEIAPYLRSMPIMRVLKAAMKIVEGYGGPVGSIAEHAEGCRILHRLGFTHIQGALYAWLK